MRNELEEIGDIIRQTRELPGLLQPGLSALADVSTRTIQPVEQGKGNPSLDTLFKLIYPLGLRFEVVLKSASNNDKE